MPHSPVYAPKYKIKGGLWMGPSTLKRAERKFQHSTETRRGEVWSWYERMAAVDGWDFIPLYRFPIRNWKEDHFMDGYYDSGNSVYHSGTTWTGCSIAGGGAGGAIVPRNNPVGGVVIQTGNLNGCVTQVLEGTYVWNASSEAVLDASFTHSNQTFCYIAVGFIGAAAGNHYAKIDSNNGGNWYFRTNDNVAEEATDTGEAYSSGNRPKRVTITLTESECKCYIDGVEKASHTVRIPASSMRIGMAITTNDNATKQCELRYMNVNQFGNFEHNPG